MAYHTDVAPLGLAVHILLLVWLRFVHTSAQGGTGYVFLINFPYNNGI